MSSYKQSSRRRREKIALRAAGRAAALRGAAIETCPHRFMDAYQWRRGYHEAFGLGFDADAERLAARPCRLCRGAGVICEFDSGPASRCPACNPKESP